MNCNDKYVKILYNGMQIRDFDSGCADIQHKYITETNLDSPVYEWTLDDISQLGKPILSTDSSFTYTFDNKTHRLYLVVYSPINQCSIQTTILETGKTCEPLCPNNCRVETVDVPAGYVNYLTSNFGNKYSPSRGYSFECSTTKSTINDNTCQWIEDILKGQPHCKQAPIKVYWESNGLVRNCVKLTIINSPIKFTEIMINGSVFSFITTNC